MGSAKLWNRIAVLLSFLMVFACGQNVMSQTRIAEAIRNDQRVTLSKTTSPLIAKSVEAGRLPGGQNLGRMLLLLAPTAEQDQAAEQLVNDLHDASSPSFHQWLSPADFGKRFGIADADAAQVQQWLQSRGLTVHEISQSRRFIVFSGSVSQVENAFATEMHKYSYQQNGKELSFISNSKDIQIPAALQAVVKGVVRLHSDPRNPQAVMGGKVYFNRSTKKFTFASGDHVLAPADFAKIYNVQPLYDAGIDGTGQSIAIIGRSQIEVQNVRDFPNDSGTSRERSGDYSEWRRSRADAGGYARGTAGCDLVRRGGSDGPYPIAWFRRATSPTESTLRRRTSWITIWRR